MHGPLLLFQYSLHKPQQRHSGKCTEAEFMNVSLLRFLGIIFRVLRLEVSVYNVYITKLFQTSFAQEGGVVKSVSRGNCGSKDFCLNMSTNSASVQRQKLVDNGAEKGQI